MNKTSWIGLFVSALAVSGCGAAPQVENFVNDLAKQQCAWQFKCCTDAEIKKQDGMKFADASTCQSYAALALTDTLYLSTLAAKEGRLKVDSDKAKACIAANAARACNPKPGQPQPMVDPMAFDACLRVFVGSTKVGDECVYPNECIQGAHCVSDKGSAGRGVCVPYQQDGEICNSDVDCDPSVKGLYCPKADYHCHLVSKLGEACVYTFVGSTPTLPMLRICDPKNASLFCDPASSLCQKLPGDGQPCLASKLPGVNSSCDPDPALSLVCDMNGGGNGVCRATGQLGADCSRFGCHTGLYCDRTGGKSVCANPPTLGESCQNSQGVCQKPYFCNPGKQFVCDQPAGLGQDCTATTCDLGLYCDRNNPPDICKAQLPEGATCTGSDQCLSFSCVNNGNGRICQAGAGNIMCVGR